MDLPIPKHLEEILKPIGEENNENYVLGKVQCTCGNENLEINYVGDDSEFEIIQGIKEIEIEKGYFLIIKSHCTLCNADNMLFDSDYHGWNGYVCEGFYRDWPRPSSKLWTCDNCGSSQHKIQLGINSEGKEDFMEEGGGIFGEENWAEGFSWLVVKTECSHCNKINPEWISYETM